MSKETHSSDESMMMRKKFPKTKVLIDYIFKRVQYLVGAAILGGGVSGFSLYQDKHNKAEIWQEAGPHLQDAHNEIYSNMSKTAILEIDYSNLLQRVEQLEKR